RSRPTNLRCRPPCRGVDPGANFRLAEGRKRTSSAGRELEDDSRLHVSGSPKGRTVVGLSPPSSQTPPATPIETFARYHQGSRLHPRTAQACRGQNRGRPTLQSSRMARVNRSWIACPLPLPPVGPFGR